MFFGHCHRTRFRGSFCLASVFEMTVYLLTYLLVDVIDYSVLQLPPGAVDEGAQNSLIKLYDHKSPSSFAIFAVSRDG